MKKILALVMTILLVSSCSYFDKRYTRNYEPTPYEESNVSYMIESPYGLEDFSEDTTPAEVYAIVATRSVNKMLDQTRVNYENLGITKLFISEIKVDEDDNENLPAGFYLSQKTLKDIIVGSRTYSVVNNIQDADYYIESLISRVEIEGQNSPVIQYKMMMYDNKDNKVGEWVETIRQVTNDDRSWW